MTSDALCTPILSFRTVINFCVNVFVNFRDRVTVWTRSVDCSSERTVIYEIICIRVIPAVETISSPLLLVTCTYFYKKLCINIYIIHMIHL